jgi:3-methylfumaryl-CoA hydratase
MTDVVTRSELLVPGPAQALGALLDVPVPDLEKEGLPLLWHWIYLLDRPAQADLGLDGHPVRGTVRTPPGAGRRRMWAGGRVRSSEVLRCGETATRRSRVLSIQDKLGRSGRLTFVTVGHQVLQRGHVVIDEQQDIVYREGATTARGPTSPASHGPLMPTADGEWAIEVSPTLLFRFSALTYNAHRIHYDRDYARDEEGYPGLLIHGPLQTLAMAEAARVAGHRSSQVGLEFRYRMESPLFDYQGMVVKAVAEQETTVTAVRDIYGRQSASGALRPTAHELARGSPLRSAAQEALPAYLHRPHAARGFRGVRHSASCLDGCRGSASGRPGQGGAKRPRGAAPEAPLTRLSGKQIMPGGRTGRWCRGFGCVGSGWRPPPRIGVSSGRGSRGRGGVSQAYLARGALVFASRDMMMDWVSHACGGCGRSV